MSKTPHIVIAGAGSIGFFIGGLLQQSGHKISYLTRQRMIEKFETNRLHITDYKSLNIKIDAKELELYTEPNSLEHADIILVTVKSSATREMAKLIEKYAKPDAIIVSLQNGISNSEILKTHLSKRKVLAGMVPFNVVQMQQARFHRGTSGNIMIENSEHKLSNTLTSDLLVIEETNEIGNIQSGKLLINLNNALNALSGLPLLEQLNNRSWRKIMADQMSEAHTIMKNSGMNPKPPSPVSAWLIPHILRLPTVLFKIIAKQMLSIDPTARSSMWEDLQQGRKTEVMELQGEVIKLATHLNIDAPINSKVMLKIKEAEEHNQGSPQLRPEDII